MESGTQLGHYTISSLIGKGGMGEVYQAKDEKLGRQVAIKVLPEEFARDTDRVARFRREAQLLASLNHPNIAAIHGLEEANGKHFLVLELVEGETLADQLQRGAIRVEESLELAIQIAEALEAAHEKGVIHRDLKPLNIKVTPEGKVKVLDFGLAKAFESEGPDPGLSNSPTLSMAATQQGVILGTAAYMSPEQAKGRKTDKRTDIWAFGAVLYEMLTGRQSFGASDASEALAAVIRADPDWNTLPANLHPRLKEVLERCLEKNPDTRFRDIGDVKTDIKKVLGDPSGVIIKPVAEVIGAKARPQSKLMWVAAMVLGVVVAGVAGWNLRSIPVEPPTRLSFNVPSGFLQQGIAVSPDGRTIVYGGPNNLGSILYRQNLGEWEGQPIPGTEGGQNPFFSPDGQWIGFQGPGQTLSTISLVGGPPVPLGGAQVRGGTWSEDGMILFGTTSQLFQVSADGGEVTPVTTLQQDEPGSHRSPTILPGGRAALFTLDTGSIDTSQIAVVNLETGTHRPLVGGVQPRYVPTGHIVFGREESLWAIPFDLERLETTGTAVPVLDGVGVAAGSASSFAFADGSLFHLPPFSVGSGQSLVWVTSEGDSELIETIPAGNYRAPRLSPNEESVLLWDGNDASVWELASGRRIPVTTDGSGAGDAEWSPNGEQIAYSSGRTGPLAIFVQPSDGSGEAVRITNLPGQVEVDSWSPSGELLAAHYHPPGGGVNIFMIPVGETVSEPEVFRESEPLEEGVTFSSDGRYVAYSSNETGQREIYIQPYPGPGPRTPVSVGGGVGPMWREDQLFYRTPALGRMMVVSVTTEPELDVGEARELFDDTYLGIGALRPDFDVTADGQRFLMLTSGSSSTSEEPAISQINVVLNWIEELKERVPVD